MSAEGNVGSIRPSRGTFGSQNARDVGVPRPRNPHKCRARRAVLSFLGCRGLAATTYRRASPVKCLASAGKSVDELEFSGGHIPVGLSSSEAIRGACRSGRCPTMMRRPLELADASDADWAPREKPDRLI